MEFLKELLSEFLGLDELATSVSENRALIDAQGGEEIITLFEPGDVQVFMKDFDATGEFAGGSVGGYFRNGMLTVWAEQPSDKLSNDVGDIVIVPNKVQSLIAYGGVGPKVVGAATFRNSRGSVYHGVCRWVPGPDGRLGVEVEVQTEIGQARIVSGSSSADDEPENLHYGAILRLTIALP